MSNRLILLVLLVCFGHSVRSQDVPGLSYCLLFDSHLEKQAFQDDKASSLEPLVFLLAPDPLVDSATYKKVKGELLTYSDKLLQKKARFKSDVLFLQYVYRDIHRKYLKRYDYPESFNGLFNTGRYNCVSGVALYASLLNGLGYSTSIYETRFHLFLVIELANSSIMIETTDPFNGFVVNESDAKKRINEYLAGEQKRAKQKETLAPPFNTDTVYEKISLRQLSGLHYYNIGVNHINNEDFLEGLKGLKKASILYPASKRIQHLLNYALGKYEAEISIALN